MQAKAPACLSEIGESSHVNTRESKIFQLVPQKNCDMAMCQNRQLTSAHQLTPTVPGERTWF